MLSTNVSTSAFFQHKMSRLIMVETGLVSRLSLPLNRKLNLLQRIQKLIDKFERFKSDFSFYNRLII